MEYDFDFHTLQIYIILNYLLSFIWGDQISSGLCKHLQKMKSLILTLGHFVKQYSTNPQSTDA